MIAWGLAKARRSGLPTREDHEMFSITDHERGIHLAVRKPQAGYAIIGLQCRSCRCAWDPVRGVVTELGMN